MLSFSSFEYHANAEKGHKYDFEGICWFDSFSEYVEFGWYHSRISVDHDIGTLRPHSGFIFDWWPYGILTMDSLSVLNQMFGCFYWQIVLSVLLLFKIYDYLNFV